MPAIRRQSKLQHRAQHNTTTYPLPNFHTTTNDIHVKLIRVKVLNRPRLQPREGTTWTVDEEPASPVHVGGLVILYNDHGESGIGRISSAVDLHQHWVTFTIAGAENPTYLRSPTTWARLDDLVAYTYTTLFHTLLPYPEPPAAARRGISNRAPDQRQPPVPRDVPGDHGNNGVRIMRITRGSRRGQD